VNSDFRVGPWLVQPSLNTISQNGTSKRVEPKMMGGLVCLAEHTGEVVPKEKLLQAVWPDTFVSDDVLKRSVSELRHVFGDDAHESRIIETIPKRGYRLLVAVTPSNAQARDRRIFSTYAHGKLCSRRETANVVFSRIVNDERLFVDTGVEFAVNAIRVKNLSYVAPVSSSGTGGTRYGRF
jgi:DNA-binding winged helix-turn-helix (wHTH) protein